MTYKASNFAYSTLGAGITNVATTLTVASGHGVRFPVANDGGSTPTEYFHLVLQDASNNFEVIKVTRHDTGSDSFTITRAQEDATQYPARAWSLGDMVELRPTVGTVQGMVDDALADSPAMLGVPTATTAAVDTSTTQIATTAFVIGQAAAATPAALGTAAAGSSTRYARADHVHTDAIPATAVLGNGVTGATQSAGDNTTKVATTAFVSTAVDALKDVSANSQSTSYTLVLGDRGKSIDFTGSTGQTITVPANAAVAFPVGSVVTITNTTANNLSIAITTDTMRWAGTANTGTRTLLQYGVATIRKVASTTWIISGAGLS